MSWWLWTKRCGIRLATGQDFTPILTCGKSQSIGRHATGVKTRHSEGRHPTCSDGAHGRPWAPLTRVQQRREGRTRAVLLALFFFLGLRRTRLWVVSGTERPTRPSAGALQPRTLARPSRLHTAVPTRGSCCIQTEVRPQTAHPDGGRYAGPRPHRGV